MACEDELVLAEALTHRGKISAHWLHESGGVCLVEVLHYLHVIRDRVDGVGHSVKLSDLIEELLGVVGAFERYNCSFLRLAN